jgi:hypothetical protein
MNWRRSRPRPARRPRARQVWLPGQESWGKGGSTMSPSLVAGRRTRCRPGRGGVPRRRSQEGGPCDLVAPGLELPGWRLGAASRAAGYNTPFRFRFPHWRPAAGGRGTRLPGRVSCRR